MMKVASLLFLTGTNAAFVPALFSSRAPSRVVLRGYLDDLSKDLYAQDANPDIDTDSKEATDARAEEKDRFGVGSWDSYVEFNEFDGGDGQMGVAGDGNKGLEKFGDDVQPQLAKSKMMSAKNAWGTSTGYAQELVDQGVEATRAQQIENWRNQQELTERRKAHQYETGAMYEQSRDPDEDWRMLAKFGVERNQDFDLAQEFGPVVPGNQIEGVIELHSRINYPMTYEFSLKNEYMGFADFRAAFTDNTSMDWTVEPHEGSLSKDPVNFIVKFRPQNPGVQEGFLVIDTEDMKKTWKLVGSTA